MSSDPEAREFKRVLAATKRVAPPAPDLPQIEKRRASPRPIAAIAYGFAAVLVLVGVGAVVKTQTALNPTSAVGTEALPPAGACSSTGGAIVSGEVDGTSWSVSIEGTPPSVWINGSIDGALTFAAESDNLSWWNHREGSWEWAYTPGSVDFVSGKLPVGATARATLGDGTTVPLCSVGRDLDHGVNYAAGAFPPATAIHTIEVVNSAGTTVGVWQLAEALESAQIELGTIELGTTLVTGIQIPAP